MSEELKHDRVHREDGPFRPARAVKVHAPPTEAELAELRKSAWAEWADAYMDLGAELTAERERSAKFYLHQLFVCETCPDENNCHTTSDLRINGGGVPMCEICWDESDGEMEWGDAPKIEADFEARVAAEIRRLREDVEEWKRTCESIKETQMADEERREWQDSVMKLNGEIRRLRGELDAANQHVKIVNKAAQENEARHERELEESATIACGTLSAEIAPAWRVDVMLVIGIVKTAIAIVKAKREK